MNIQAFWPAGLLRTLTAAPLAACLFSLVVPVSLRSESWSVTSPNGQLRLTVQLADLGGKADYPRAMRLYYRVEHIQADRTVMVIEDSPLGLVLEAQDFLQNLRFEGITPATLLDERYEMPHGKRRQCHNRAQASTLTVRNAVGRLLELDLRAYDDGVAFRYRIPGSGPAVHTLEVEATGFALPAEARLWMHPSDQVTRYSPAYETYFESDLPVGTNSPTGAGWAFPILFRTGDSRQWALITEANVGTNYFGGRLTRAMAQNVYRLRLPDVAEGNGTGAIQPSSPLPWETPWRVIMVGDSLADIVESTLVTDVCEPSRVKDTSWIRPGRVAWSWWSDPPSPQDGAKQKKFIDFAAEMGWEYLLVDANWTIMDHGTIHDVLRYAKGKGVGVLLWYNSGGPHNVVTEKPRDSLYFPEVRRFEFDLLRKWGVRGVKVDFFQSDKQNVLALYHDILQDAAEYQIMVNFHGCTLPRGWSRTWPHLMAMEAVRGAECYIFDKQFPERAPVQNTITPFTRNVVGPMDYTPVAFSNNTYPHRTTAAHELALSVLFESGWVHFADKPEAYLNLPSAPKEFLQKLPAAWDDTRFVAGYPGQFVVLARRKGEAWYLAGVNGEAKARDVEIRLGPWADQGAYQMERIGDADSGAGFATETRRVARTEAIKQTLRPYGGFVATLVPTQPSAP